MRNLIRYIVAAVAIAVVMGQLRVLQSVARAQTTTTTQAVQQDNFDDNKKGTLWKVYADSTDCTVKEINKRLEFTAKANETPMATGYVADKWPIDPNHNFAMRVDINYDPVTMEGGWVTFGVSPSNVEPRKQYVSFGIGCVSLFRSYWREWKDGYEVRWEFDSRIRNKVTLHISYDAASDTIYMGEAGYGPENAWQILPGLVRERWGPKPIYAFVGLYTEGAVVDAGKAFVDNFSLDEGVIVGTDTPKPPDNGGDPNTPDGDVRVDVEADASVTPAVMKRYVGVDPITVFLTLPKGYFPVNIDETKPVTLAPIGVQSTKRTTFLWLTGQVITIASFDRAKLLQAIPTDGETSLTAVGYFKDGRRYGDTITIKIE